jgi:hypothetical protein
VRRSALAVLALVAAVLVYVVATSGSGHVPDAAALARLAVVDAERGEHVDDAQIVLVDAEGRCFDSGDPTAPADWRFAIVRAPGYLARLVEADVLWKALVATASDVDVPLFRACTLEVVRAASTQWPADFVVTLTRPGTDDAPLGFIFPKESEAGRVRDRARAELAAAGESGARLVELPRMRTWFAEDIAQPNEWRARLPSERRALGGDERFAVEVPVSSYWEMAMRADEPFTIDGLDEPAARRATTVRHTSADLVVRVRAAPYGTVAGSIALPGPGKGSVSFLRRTPNPERVIGADRASVGGEAFVETRVESLPVVSGEAFSTAPLAGGSYVAEVMWTSADGRERLLERRALEVATGAVARLDLAEQRLGSGVPIEFVCFANERVIEDALLATAQVEFALARRNDDGALDWKTTVALTPRERVRLFGCPPGPLEVWIVSAPSRAECTDHWRIRPHRPWTIEMPADGKALVLEVPLEAVVDTRIEFEVPARADGSAPFVRAACCRAGDPLDRFAWIEFEPAGANTFLARAHVDLPVGRWNFVASIPALDDDGDPAFGVRADGALPVQRVVHEPFEVARLVSDPLVVRAKVDLGCSYYIEESARPHRDRAVLVKLRPTEPAELAGLSLWSQELWPGDPLPLVFGGLLPGVTYAVEPLGEPLGPLEPGEEHFTF